MTPFRCSMLPVLIVGIASLTTIVQAADQVTDRYGELISTDQPIGWWRFDDTQAGRVPNAASGDFAGTIRGAVELKTTGPRPSEFPDFAELNTSAAFSQGANFVVVSDPVDNQSLDFDNGDAITLEAWVRWDTLNGTYPYIVGKGRTHRPGMSHRNQNYSLRLANEPGGVSLSFFFCDAETESTGKGIGDAGHRWTSKANVPDDHAWHHVALTYTFGKPKSIVGYIDGKATKGRWDMSGPTTKRPVVDDELWIGSAMQGGNTFGGEIDEVAIYRSALSADQIRKHVTIDRTKSPYAIGRLVEDAPTDHVRVEIVENLPVTRDWDVRLSQPQPLFETAHFAMKHVPRKYTSTGLIDDQAEVSMLLLTSQIELPPGEYEFLLRSLGGARLYLDGELVIEVPFNSLNSDAHQPYYEGLDRGPDTLSLAEGHTEKQATVTLKGSTHTVSLYRHLGNKKHGQYLGEMLVAVRPPDGEFRILSPTGFESETTIRAETKADAQAIPFTDAGWLDFLDWERSHLANVNQTRRQSLGRSQDSYWQQRHDAARRHANARRASTQRPSLSIDEWLNTKLADASIDPQPGIDDFDFLRRASLDVIGVIPSEALIEQFLAMPESSRRADIVDVLLDDRGWADHWVGYWQDVLAENPGLTKPELNNTGPFRWFLHEAFLDNKPFDRWVTELVMMQGSRFSGGPAGFGVATQNDVPMAAKAHILGTAFLGVDMKCARCHDAPFHDVLQQDLFAMAAMLERSPLKVPGSSSITIDPDRLAQMIVKVSLAPGSEVEPAWPFDELVSPADNTGFEDVALPTHNTDTRAKLAAIITSPHNQRFAQSIVNRLWQRYLGRGIVEPVDDWEHADVSHPELLESLADELITHDYDLKHVARLILTSDAYQRATTTDSHAAKLFAGPSRKRMTGEQLVDSLLVAVGKPLEAEELTMDRDGKQPDAKFGHFGHPQRAWEFVAVSNERDRPSLNLPVAQSIIDVLSAYGWRQQRQEPLTVRETGLTPLQPMILANGTLANRLIDLSDKAEVTAVCLEEQSVETLTTRLFQRLLTRPPTDSERDELLALLKEGYQHRVTAGPEAVPPRRIYRSGITWGNHFDPKSDDEAIRRQREIIEGDRPTVRLDADWRSRVEDVVWALVNSPEFVFVP